MENLFDMLQDDNMKFKVHFAGDDVFHFEVEYSKDYEKHLKSDLDVSHNFNAVCLDADGKEAGDICFDITSPKSLYIEDVEVLSTHQRRGLGSKMLRLAEFVASEFGASRVEGLFAPSDENGGKVFYAKHGYELKNHHGSLDIVKKLDKKQKYDDVIVTDVAKYVPEEEIEI